MIPSAPENPAPARERGSRQRALTFTPAGVFGTLLLAAVVLLFLRLGFWQLDRRAERGAANRAVAARLAEPPLADVSTLADTSGITYRVTVAHGRYDNDRWIVLPGRSHRGMPGVHLLMPLRLSRGGDAVLVNRGWIPAPDAATIDGRDFMVHDSVEVRGLVLPFPGAAQSLAQQPSPSVPGEFRRTWYNIDEAALRAQFPYPLLNATLQELGNAEAGARYPIRLEPPPLDEGPHLGYAFQWFAFALIGVIGWFALVLRSRRSAVPLAAAALLFGAPSNAQAQLRPLDPLEWRIFDADARFIAGVGAGLLHEQPAPLAGTRGTLLEAGNYAVAYRSGRIAIELGGTAVWRLADQDSITVPAPGVEPDDDVRQDAGVAFAFTTLRVSPDAWPAQVALRFGATIPTTSDESGLDRDRIDFFALLSARFRRGPLALSAENGVGIHGTMRSDLPQSDVWTFAFGAAWQLSRVRLLADLVGRQDGHSYVIRGNEDQREVRAGLELGRARWLRLQYIRGLSEFSPRHGARVSAGFLLRR